MRRLDPTKRGLCQSVCLLAICRTRRTRQICGNTCPVSAHQRRSCFRSTVRPGGHAGSPSSITPTAQWPKRPSGASTSSRSKGGPSRSARRGHAKIVLQGRRGLAASAAVHARVASALHGRGASAVRVPAAAVGSAVPVQAASPLVHRMPVALQGNGTATSDRMRRRRTSGSRNVKKTAGRAARSRSARSGASTMQTKTGEPPTKRSRSTTSRPASRKTASTTTSRTMSTRKRTEGRRQCRPT